MVNCHCVMMCMVHLHARSYFLLLIKSILVLCQHCILMLVCYHFSENETKLLRLERTNRELERSLQVLKQSSMRVSAEVEKTNKKLTAQIHADKKEIARLKEVIYLSICFGNIGHILNGTLYYKSVCLIYRYAVFPTKSQEIVRCLLNNVLFLILDNHNVIFGSSCARVM